MRKLLRLNCFAPAHVVTIFKASHIISHGMFSVQGLNVPSNDQSQRIGKGITIV